MLYVKCFIAAFLSVLSIVIGKMLLTRDDNGIGSGQIVAVFKFDT